MAARGCLGSAGQDEVFQRREVLVEAVEVAFQLLDVNVRDQREARHAQLAAEVEEFVLQAVEAFSYRGRQLSGQHHANGAVQFVHRAVCLHPQVVLVDA